jgi:hypothetical protein
MFAFACEAKSRSILSGISGIFRLGLPNQPAVLGPPIQGLAHSLEAFGHSLGFLKGFFIQDFIIVHSFFLLFFFYYIGL